MMTYPDAASVVTVNNRPSSNSTTSPHNTWDDQSQAANPLSDSDYDEDDTDDNFDHGVVLGTSRNNGNKDDLQERLHKSSSQHTAPQALKTSLPSSILSMVCVTVGAGVVSLPGAIAKGGWSSLALIGLIAVLCFQSANWICACMFAIPGRRLISYEAIGEAALGRLGKRIVLIFNSVTLFGVCTIFLILIGINMNQLVPQITLHAWVLIFGGAMIPIAWLKTMKEISLLAYFGVIASIVVGIIIVVKGIQNEADTDTPINYDSFIISGIPSAFNIITFSFGSHSVLPNVVSHMRSARRSYHYLTAYSYAIIGVIYAIVAAFGYYGFGSDTQSNVLQSMDSDNIFVKLAFATIAAHVIFAYPIPLNPIALQIDALFGIDKYEPRKELMFRIILRTLLVLSTVFVASVVPYFDDMLTLISALSIVAVAFIFPPLFYYILLSPIKRFTWWTYFRMISIATIGICGSVAGIYYGIQDLTNHIESQPNPFDNFF